MTPGNISAAMKKDGLVVLDGLFSKPLLRRLQDDVMRRYRRGELRERGLVRDIAGRTTSVLPFEGPFMERAFYANPKLLRAADALLGKDWCLGSLEVVMAESGAARQYQHVDAPLRFDRDGGRTRFQGDLSALPPYALALATPLCDITEENGPTAIWPGSHREGLRAKLPSEAAIKRKYRERRLTGKLGFSYLYDYRTFHRGLPNRSAKPRPLLMLVFVRTWFRDPNLFETPGGIVVSKRALARVPARLRRLFALASRR